MAASSIVTSIASSNCLIAACAFSVYAYTQLLCLTVSTLVSHVIRMNYNGENIKDRNVLLVLYTDRIDLGITKIAKLHLQNHTSIIYKKISSVNDFNEAIQSVVNNNNKITGLFLFAHATPNGIEFSKTEVVEDAKCLENSLNMLAENATITLYCCEAGNTKKISRCIADRIAAVTPGKKVIASSKLVWDLYSDIQWEGTSIETTFGQVRGSTEIRKLFNFLVSFHSFGYLNSKYSAKHFFHPKNVVEVRT